MTATPTASIVLPVASMMSSYTTGSYPSALPARRDDVGGGTRGHLEGLQPRSPGAATGGKRATCSATDRPGDEWSPDSYQYFDAAARARTARLENGWRVPALSHLGEARRPPVTTLELRKWRWRVAPGHKPRGGGG